MNGTDLLGIITQSGGTGLTAFLIFIIYRLIEKRRNGPSGRDVNAELFQSLRSLKDAIQRVEVTITSQNVGIVTQTQFLREVIHDQLTRLERKQT